MSSRFYFILVVFFFTAILIFTVSLRNANDHLFYKLYLYNLEQGRLKQQLANKQLQLENLINPAAISEQLDEQ